MEKLEQKILLKALKNHIAEHRSPAHFRVAIKGHIHELPVEASMDERSIDGIAESSWIAFKDGISAHNAASTSYADLVNYLKSWHLENVEFGQTNSVQPEVFLKLGFVFVLSNKIYKKSKAEALVKEWKERGSSCLIKAELQDGADLFASEALALTEYSDLVKTKHLVPSGHIGRVPGSIESALIGQEADVIEEAQKMVGDAFQALDEAGLVVQIKGHNLCFSWSGISLTRAGLEMAQKIKDAAHQALLSEQEAKRGKVYHIRCIACGETLLTTSKDFDQTKPVLGHMLQFLPRIDQAGFSKGFTDHDQGENIVCPECGERLCEYNGLIRQGVLIDPPELEEEEPGPPDPKEIVNDFIIQKCAQNPSLKIRTGKLYEKYSEFAAQKNIEPASQKFFGTALFDLGFKPDRDNKTRFWRGLSLLNP